MTLTYAYCLVRAPRRPSLGGTAAGVPGSRDLRALEAGRGLWLIVSTVPAALYDEAALARGLQDIDRVGRCALAHEAVVERFLSARAVLPLQLFRLFRSDERALAHIARERRTIDRVLARVDGQHEFGLRMTVDAPQAPRPRGARAPASGAEYLARKRDVLAASRDALASARTEATRLYRAMSREATRARRRTELEQAATPPSRLVLDAAFLVPAARGRAFRASVRKHARAFGRAGLAVSLTGPWPPYNFIGGSGRTPRASA